MLTTILMCPPTFFTVDYVINPWMQGQESQVDLALAQQQWEALKETLEKVVGAQVSILKPVKGLPDLVFTANAAFVYDHKAIIANFKHPERQGETPVNAAWFQDHGYKVHMLPEKLSFEGAGDALIWTDPRTQEKVVLAGYRTRTDIRSHQALSIETGLRVLSLELVDDRFYHIDVCLCPTDTGHLIYAPCAFDEYGNQVIEDLVPEAYRIVVGEDEICQFACNAVNVGRHVVVNQKAPKLIAALREAGLKPHPLNLSEFIKAGGSCKCLTLRIA